MNILPEEKIQLEKVLKKYKEGDAADNYEISPVKVTDGVKMSKIRRNFYVKKGMRLIKSGKIAAVTMAGGQGTRLGHSGPKGTFVVDSADGKSLFEILCGRLMKFSGGAVPWYIMTSHINYEETVKFFKEKEYFGYPKENIEFFIQDRIAVMDTEGNPVYEENGEIMRTPNGNGGAIGSMKSSGVLDDMERRGTEYVFVCGIDNCLAKIADPFFAGFAALKGCDISAKSCIKRCETEKAGTFCLKNGRPGVVEYTEMPEEKTKLRGKDGNLLYGDINILSYFMKFSWVKQMAGAASDYHVAVKKLKYYTKNGDGTMEEREGECVKAELFLFDLFEKAKNMSVLRVERDKEFAPVKNKTGDDSPETAVILLRNNNAKMAEQRKHI